MTRILGSARTVSEILEMWEQALDMDAVQRCTLQTTVYLARIHDVPDDIVEALDAVVGICGPSMPALHKVVRYLRELEGLARLAGP